MNAPLRDRAERAGIGAGRFIASRAPPRDEPALRPRGHRSKRNRDHARLLKPYR